MESVFPVSDPPAPVTGSRCLAFGAPIQQRRRLRRRRRRLAAQSTARSQQLTATTQLTMLSRRITAARPLTRALQATTPRTTLTQIRRATVDHGDASVEDPRMNGQYPNPPPIKRQFRDPYGDWWDKQERRNYGEPVNEDNDILGIFSTEAYTHFKPGFGAVLLGTFVASVGVLMGVVYQFYPDKASVPRTWPDGLEAELGGKNAWSARKEITDL